jgi:hypothetical protein
MKYGSDTVILFETLIATERQYDGIASVDESYLIPIILDIATDKYQAVLTSEQSDKGEILTL